ncbi:preprotein translocase subunit SecG [Enterobacteriaceae endosymbiont of Donacia bicoloricornis]|uniref:preprotein translocase subunit SecG n=1 Tax=Enterobacteriaceae endosymbiont of Donacia bicoloricornis TaxID=2675772 RepID=UPI001448FB7C|nr:preprotein translocase subunit SecG [Enterobacteriaceae endosymbiont of Donacia bicoloricornis]QJC37827.1 preprotein translocase subunit SecG [Enterobacteriaceae endosymbiont of Donacia bicoloricornis]
MYKLLLILFIFVSFFLVSIIMFQDNDDIDISASSNNIKSPFNTNMSNKILTKSIILLTSLFFIISLLLSNINVKKYIKNVKLNNVLKK